MHGFPFFKRSGILSASAFGLLLATSSTGRTLSALQLSSQLDSRESSVPASLSNVVRPNLNLSCFALQSNNILGKDFLLLPLVDSTHASLLIVHRLAGQPAPGASAGIVGAAGGSGAGGKPCILHLDSLHVKGQGHRPNLGALRALLQRVAQQVPVGASMSFPLVAVRAAPSCM